MQPHRPANPCRDLYVCWRATVQALPHVSSPGGVPTPLPGSAGPDSALEKLALLHFAVNIHYRYLQKIQKANRASTDARVVLPGRQS